MFAGHVGAGLALGRAQRQTNVGVLIFAALLLDFLLWKFVLLGWESVVLPADFATAHQARYEFPYSHGLLASLGWSLLAAFAMFAWARGRRPSPGRAAFVVGAAVFSHWVLDALVHVPELPLAGAGSPRLGLGLWGRMSLALIVESVIVVAGFALYAAGAPVSRARTLGLGVLAALTLALTVVGMTLAPAPPSAAAMAVSSLVTLVIVVALAGWLGHRPRTPPA